MTTYDWIKSFLTIAMEGRVIYGNLKVIRFTGQWKIPFQKITMQTIDKRAVMKRCRQKITEVQWTMVNFV